MKEVLLVGNPNSGKTTLFNSLTSSNEHIGNWHGVTVETKQKAFEFEGEKFLLVDTPGIYSLCALSFEEEVAVNTILSKKNQKIINICDKNNLQRNLYLTLCLLERGCDVILAINEIDKKSIYKIDYKQLGEKLGVEVVCINAEKKVGLFDLKKALSKKNKKTKLPYLKQLSGELQGYDLIKAYEKDEKYFKQEISSVPDDSLEIIAKLRYGYIEELLSSCTKKTGDVYGKSRLDRIFLNKWLALPMFLLVLSIIFYLTFFSLGSFLSDILQNFLSWVTRPLTDWLFDVCGNTWIFDLFNVAILGGVATVLSFLPQVVLLFFFLSILEDSGYMARIAFVFEDILGRIGLSGKSVYTLLMGFGCSTSAIMTARNMDDKNAKIKTAILCPYMSCSAKIPIYTVLGGAFFGASNLLCIIGLYLLGVVVAIAISKILDSTILKSEKQSFILEFPPYRTTSLKRVFKTLWKNTKSFLLKVGSVMLSMNVIIWLLSAFSFKFSYVATSGEPSMLESIGKFLAPIFTPLGFNNWAIVSALLAGLVAKEVVVSSIAMFNGIDAGATKLISESILVSSNLVYFSSVSSILSFLVFCLLYTPCVASISMLNHEIGKKWTLFSVVLQFFTAYLVSFVIYTISFAIEIFGFVKIFLLLLAILSIILAIWFVVRKVRKKEICANCEGCKKSCNKRRK
ncbi:MAG: ferrous iron transport protein B [Clostridiales bacterium]|nr:ferrous iron transport protein B [Clostridiales bacterium]